MAVLGDAKQTFKVARHVSQLFSFLLTISLHVLLSFLRIMWVLACIGCIGVIVPWGFVELEKNNKQRQYVIHMIIM